jgi:hypothetical protein
VYKVLQSEGIALKIKKAYFELYQDVFLDVAPFLCLAKSENFCYVWETLSLEKKNLQQQQMNTF